MTTIEPWLFVLRVGAALGCGLVGGVFFAFSNFVMNALARLPPAQGSAAMQSINITVINPLFMALLFGAGLLCLAQAGSALLRWQQPGSAVLLAASLLYLIGNVLVTLICNVPLNDALAKADPHSVEGAQLWARYLIEWTRWNHVRTLTALAAAALFTIGSR